MKVEKVSIDVLIGSTGHNEVTKFEGSRIMHHAYFPPRVDTGIVLVDKIRAEAILIHGAIYFSFLQRLTGICEM